MPITLPEQVIVGHRFHVRPLLPLLAADGQFYVYTITEDGRNAAVHERSTVAGSGEKRLKNVAIESKIADVGEEEIAVGREGER